MHTFTKLVFFTGFLLLFNTAATAQCEHVGWVASVTPGCGAKIINLDNGALFDAVVGANNLVAGQTIRFSSKQTAPTPGCPVTGLPVHELTCLSDTLPCKASFGYTTDKLNAFNLSFEADIYDANLQKCQWSFGDGATASGRTVEHTFPHEGFFNVCLTVSDNKGCKTQFCQNTFVSEQNPNWCDYDVYVTAVGTKLYGKLLPVGGAGNTLLSVKWFDSKSSAVLAETPDFSHELPGYGSYLVCAQYEVGSPDGGTCTTTRCQQLTLAEPGCVLPAIANPTAFCPSVYAPVCGCDAVTYGNECEAMAAGATTWWSGACGMSSGPCGTDMDFSVVSGSPDLGYTVRFRNLASGDFSFIQLDFGDGTPLYEATKWDSIDHKYKSGGIYRTNLTAWKYGSCVSSLTKLLITDALNMSLENIPDGTDYVMPGDANGDKKANVYDLLNIGVGYLDLGSPRPNATTDWAPQFAPNWPDVTGTGVNYKHLDCDGNGTVNEFDRGPIEQHYQSIDSTDVAWNPVLPKVWLKFAQDTIYIDPNNPGPVEISADVMIGSNSAPALDIHGLAYALKYPEYVDHDPEVDYADNSNSFFGESYMLRLSKDNYPRRQLDMGLTRINGQPASGFGRIATITFRAGFIIIVDITDRAENKTQAFMAPITGLKAVDAKGKEKYLSTPLVQDTVWIKLKKTTATHAVDLSDRVLLSPNPATDIATVYTGDLEVERMEIVNTLGQVVQRQQGSGQRSTSIEVRDWTKGIYTIRILTDKGIAEKRLVVH